jgi:peptidoglycan hydrolase-like amidase
MAKNDKMTIISHSQKRIFIGIGVFLFSIGVYCFFFTSATHAAEWRYEGVAYYVPKASTGNQPIYRFYSPKYRAHFFTKSENEKNDIIKKYPTTEWRYEGIAYYVPKASTGNQPIYRFYSPRYKTHFFTKSENEKNDIIKKYPTTEWRYEGIAYYVPKASTGNRPVYRFYNTVNKAHFFTTSENEKLKLTAGMYGPNITIGLHEYTEDALADSSFRITSDKSYIIKNKSDKKIATIAAGKQTRVKYLNDNAHTYRIYNSVVPEITATDEIFFEAANGDHYNMIFEIDRPEITYSQYRGKISLRYSNNNSTKRIWVINKLPLEQYTWGMGEITATGPMEYNKLMTTAYRTYGYWKTLHSTAYAVEGFNVNATPGNQLYRGYEWEQRYPRIRQAADATRGKIIKHDGDVALTPYSSWTDGRTRDPSEVGWSSSVFPHCDSVDDPYGDYNGDYWDNSTHKSTSTLMSEGNHMVGISAHGALTLANDKNWNWDRIMKYYYNGISIVSIY